MPFPSVIDSSILDVASTCDKKLHRMYIEDWKPVGESVHLVAGKAYAAGLEAARTAFFVEGKSDSDAEAIGLGKLTEVYGGFEPPEGSAKSLDRTLGALEYYFDVYPLRSELALPLALPGGRLGIEVNFVEPLPLTHPDTGDPILFCGRLDQAVRYAGGVYAMDDKTTSSLGGNWARSWDMRGQFTGYCWGLSRAANITPTGVLVRGVAILKTKYDTQQAITYRPPHMIEEWYSIMLRRVRHMIECYESGLWDKTGLLSKACSDFGGCTFVQPCMSQEPSIWLSQYFERRHWDPLLRTETRLELDKPFEERFLTSN